MAVTLAMQGIRLAVSDVIGSRETNILTVILDMHEIILALSGTMDSRETNILAVVTGMHDALLKHMDLFTNQFHQVLT